MCNVTLWHNHCHCGEAVNIKHSVCLHSCLSYPACKVHALYYTVMCSQSGYNINMVFITIKHNLYIIFKIVN
jgi:hypothetical protein